VTAARSNVTFWSVNSSRQSQYQPSSCVVYTTECGWLQLQPCRTAGCHSCLEFRFSDGAGASVGRRGRCLEQVYLCPYHRRPWTPNALSALLGQWGTLHQAAFLSGRPLFRHSTSYTRISHLTRISAYWLLRTRLGVLETWVLVSRRLETEFWKSWSWSWSWSWGLKSWSWSRSWCLRVSVLVLVLKVLGLGLGLETMLWLLNKRKAIISKPIISIYSCLSRVT